MRVSQSASTRAPTRAPTRSAPKRLTRTGGELMDAGAPPPVRRFQGGDRARYWRNFVIRPAKHGGWDVVQYREHDGTPIVIEGGDYQAFRRVHDRRARGGHVGTVRTLRDATELAMRGQTHRFFLADGYKKGARIAKLSSFGPQAYGWRNFTIRPGEGGWDVHAYRDEEEPVDVTRWSRERGLPPPVDDSRAELVGTFTSLRDARLQLVEARQEKDSFVTGLSLEERLELDEWWRAYEFDLRWDSGSR